MIDVEARLNELGIELPEPPAPVAAYVPWVRTGNLVMISGQIPFKDGDLLARGPVPSVVSAEEAQDAARCCAINGLESFELDDFPFDAQDLTFYLTLNVQLGKIVQSDDRFGGQPGVANGASELMVEIFCDAGRHARAAVGVNALPLDVSVEVEFVFEVD